MYNNPNKNSPSSSPSPTVVIQSPEIVVESYYSTYLNCVKRNHAENNGNQDVEIEFERWRNCLTEPLSDTLVQKLTDNPGFADPILCAQDWPTSISVDPAVIQGNTATTTVHEKFETDKPITVDLIYKNNQWYINNITCHLP